MYLCVILHVRKSLTPAHQESASFILESVHFFYEKAASGLTFFLFVKRDSLQFQQRKLIDMNVPKKTDSVWM